MIAIAILASVTLLPTYNKNTASLDTSWYSGTADTAEAANSTKTTHNAETVSNIAGFAIFNAKIMDADKSLLWYPVSVCAVISVMTQLVLIYQTRSVR
jgi:hypothetical protein